MRDSDDAVVLTDEEREVLAGLARSIGDPWLARQLAGHHDASPGHKRRLAWRPAVPEPAAGWVGGLLTLIGAAFVVGTFATSTVLASLGLALMGFGLWRLVVDHGDAVIRRISEPRRTDALRPAPPHTPPGAA